MKTVEEKIEEIRMEKGVSVQKLVDALGISRQGYLQMIKNNSTSVETLSKICKFFGVGSEYFLGQVQQQNSTNEELVLVKKSFDYLLSELDRYRRREDEIYSKLGKYRGATTMNGVGFGILDYSDMAFRAN